MITTILRKPALAMAAIAFAVTSAYAAPTTGPSGIAFYTAPASLTGTHGDLISYRTATVNLGANAPAVKAWNVLYQSTDSVGAANAVTGTVIVPTTAWAGTGERPIISYAVGTHGLAQPCAPSLQLAGGTDYETANIAAALKAGYAVLVTDYAGYTTGSTPTYLAGASQGNAVLDIVRAASQVPSVGLSATAKTAIWGYSQGGQSASFAAERKATYAPSLNLVGVAAGGTPADFITTAKYLDGSNGASFLFGGVVGLAEQYPAAIPLNTLANATGQAAIARAKNQCVFEALFDLMNHSLSEYTVGNQTLDQLVAVPAINATLKAQDLGSTKVTVPLYQYHGQADEFIPIEQHVELKRKYCAKFSNVYFDVYPSEHIVTQFQAAPTVLTWFGDRFNGKGATSSCLTLSAFPKSTANPNKGNFVVSLKSWPLVANVGLKTLGQTVNLPTTSTFTAETDITAQRLTGTLSVPNFSQSIKILGIGSQVGMKITPVGDATGTVSLDNDGQLHVHGLVKADITITSLSGLPIGSCKTVTPVEFPINFDGPISSLGNGNLNFSGTTTFPQLKGCGVSAILTAVMSGPGQTYSFTVKPPAPRKF
ncbi:lipase family protein [Aquabacterium sp.]|uniref:lipase family protein n=1 Tax=Aquabacterium sp. TaxID=1872578 RepID=UPI002489BF0C|nr:lipase family protein [Aquabacterium sp.]MDI1261293.1 lipase family protein [Aquabacterium sp.]